MSQTKFGRFAVAEAPSSLFRLHFHDGSPLKTVDWEPKNSVLDQEDLLAQGIDTSVLVPGAQKVDALGSCTANATMSALSNVLSTDNYFVYANVVDYADTKGIEEAAILFYHNETDLTGNTGTEWPPVDCGGSGPYIVALLEKLGLVSTDKIAHGGENILSLMQQGGVLAGIPYLNDWMEPDSSGFVDGDGSLASLEQQIDDGIAGGHEIYLSAIEKIGSPIGTSVVRFRNSWSKTWGDNGSARFHLSTLEALGNQADFRLLVA